MSKFAKFDLVFGLERNCFRAAYESLNDNLQPDYALQRIFVEGQKIDKSAQQSIFSEGITITSWNVKTAAKETAALMADDSVTRINQATFITPDGETTRLDSIKRSGDKWNHEEVKSGCSVKDKYIFDAFISTKIAKDAGLDINQVKLVLLNKNWRRDAPRDELFKYIDITEKMDDVEILNFLTCAHESLLSGNIPEAKLVLGCWNCQYFSSCFGEIELPITLVKRLSEKKIDTLSEKGVLDIRDIPEDFVLTEVQRRVIKSALKGENEVNRVLIQENLQDLREPVIHLDFEWVAFAEPIHKQVPPWGPVATQFSVHKETKEGLQHTEFLSNHKGDGRRELAEKLIQSLGEQGSIVVYSKTAEIGRIKDMKIWFPDLKQQLSAIEKRIFDLHPLVRDGLIYPKFLGKSSLKLVPLIVPGFDYKDLVINNGEDALGAMNLMMRGVIADDIIPALRENLLRYCERDTEATVRILEVLRGFVEDV